MLPGMVNLGAGLRGASGMFLVARPDEATGPPGGEVDREGRAVNRLGEATIRLEKYPGERGGGGEATP